MHCADNVFWVWQLRLREFICKYLFKGLEGNKGKCFKVYTTIVVYTMHLHSSSFEKTGCVIFNIQKQ